MAQNITLLGASYSNVPAVQLPKTGGGTASFTDVTDTTAAAADVASGKYFYTAAGVRTAGTSSGGGGGSSYTLVESKEVAINQTSTTEASKLDIPFTRKTSSIVYVKIRDKAGKRNGYFYGSDNFIIDLIKANNKAGAQAYIPKALYGITSAGIFYGDGLSNTFVASGGYGVYVKLLNNANGIRIYAKYNSSFGTINGTFTVDVYELQWPGNVSPLS